MDESIRVLHVDDDPELAELAATFLEREDERFDVRTTTDPGAGLGRLDELEFDCVISDYEMPDQNGIEFLEAVRERYPDLPFILFTGKGSEEIASEAISAGVTDYLQKESGTDHYRVLANRIANVVEAYRSRKMLDERTRRLETLISNLPGIVYQSENDPDWPMITVKGEVSELTGYTAAQLRSGEVIWGEDILHPEEREPMWAAVQEGLEEDGTFEVTYRIITKDETTKWMWERGRGVYSEDGHLTAVEGFITDITDQREREERLAAYINNNSDVLGLVSKAGVFEDLSPSVKTVLGYEPAELKGVSVFQHIHPDDTERVMEEFRDLVESGATRRIEYRFEKADGSWTWLESVASDKTDSTLDGYVVTTRDVTERKEREQELIRQNEKLDAFTSFVSHDLRNSLNVANLRLDLAAEECSSRHLDEVDQTIDRMDQLIEDLLVLAEQGEAVGETVPVSLQSLVSNCWSNVKTTEAAIDVETGESIQADRSRLVSLMENLLRNAVEHGGQAVTITVGQLEDETGFYVADDGPGIPEADRGEIFDNGYTTKDDGTGLGLAIVEQVAEAHGWEIALTESETGGARFEITGVEFVDPSSSQ